MRRHALDLARVGHRPAWRRYSHHVRAALYVLVFAALAYGVFLLTASRTAQRERLHAPFSANSNPMSASMRWLALVQFCSWFTLFTIFIYTTPAVAKLHFGSEQSRIAGYEAGGQLGWRAVRHLQRPRRSCSRWSSRISSGAFGMRVRAPDQPVDREPPACCR